MSSPLSLVSVAEGRPSALSVQVAEHFEKPHNRVLSAIRTIIKDLPPDLCQSNFRQASYEVKQPKGGTTSYPAYLLSRDGFTLLAMGFTGKKALAWKIRYIQAFNEMERQLLAAKHGEPLPPSPLSTIEDRHPLVEICNLLTETVNLPKPSKADYAKVRADVSKYMGVQSWSELHRDDVPRAVAYVRGRIDAAAKALPQTEAPKALPAVADDDKQRLDSLFDELMSFEARTNRTMHDIGSRLADITGPLYKEAAQRLGTNNTREPRCLPDALINGLHASRYEALDEVKEGFEDMVAAVRLARTVATMIQPGH